MIDRERAVDLSYDLLRTDLNEDLVTPRGEQVVVLSESVTEYSTAWLVPFNTKSFIEGGDIDSAMIPSAVLVPKDPAFDPHYPPTAIDVPEYLEMIEQGEMQWPRQQ
jgi:hypothetical protein